MKIEENKQVGNYIGKMSEVISCLFTLKCKKMQEVEDLKKKFDKTGKPVPVKTYGKLIHELHMLTSAHDYAVNAKNALEVIQK